MGEYIRRTWVDGEIITAEKLNNMETGITEAMKNGETALVPAQKAEKLAATAASDAKAAKELAEKSASQESPVFTGSISMGRKEGTEAGSESVAAGHDVEASGDYSQATGLGTTAASDCQTVQGMYNVEDTENEYLVIVGNGSSDSDRSNAHTLDRNGKAWYPGGVFVGGSSAKDASPVLFYSCGTEDLTAGESPLETGKIHLVYE